MEIPESSFDKAGAANRETAGLKGRQCQLMRQQDEDSYKMLADVMSSQHLLTPFWVPSAEDGTNLLIRCSRAFAKLSTKDLVLADSPAIPSTSLKKDIFFHFLSVIAAEWLTITCGEPVTAQSLAFQRVKFLVSIWKLTVGPGEFRHWTHPRQQKGPELILLSPAEAWQLLACMQMFEHQSLGSNSSESLKFTAAS